jgi:hypothetical protein
MNTGDLLFAAHSSDNRQRICKHGVGAESPQSILKLTGQRTARNHLFLGDSIMLFVTLENQAVAGAVAERFLGKAVQARCAVPLLMPNSAEIATQERP